MSGAPKRSPLKFAGGGCVGCYGLVLVILLVTVLVWRSSVATMLEQAERERTLSRAEWKTKNSTRAGLIARAGLDAFLATLRSGVTPPSLLKGVLGRTYMDGEDRYEAKCRKVSDGVYAIDVTGQITERDRDSYDSDAQKVRVECVVEARIKVAGEEITLVSLEERETPPEQFDRDR
jgi:hypothetical protein